MDSNVDCPEAVTSVSIPEKSDFVHNYTCKVRKTNSLINGVTVSVQNINRLYSPTGNYLMNWQFYIYFTGSELRVLPNTKWERRRHSKPPDFPGSLPLFGAFFSRFGYSSKIEVQVIQTKADLSDKCGNGAIHLSFVP